MFQNNLLLLNQVKRNEKQTTDMETVTVTMKDLFTDEIVTREISATNLYVPNYNAPLDFEHDILGTEKQQRAKLEKWITERANEQHETLLELISWKLN